MEHKRKQEGILPWMKWFPWRFAIGYIARANGFLDPMTVLARLHRFAQPSEFAEPIELLRAGVVFHSRGLVNSRVIQHNMDWVWPYWVERQFDPMNTSFIPRAFSITQVNLTHRNWTAVGLPGCNQFPIVDPRGLLTPLYDGWSLDCWIISDDGSILLPSRAPVCKQQLELENGLAVGTTIDQKGLRLSTRIDVRENGVCPACHLHIQAHAPTGGWLVVALRPYNPEGISFIHNVSLNEQRTEWCIDNRQKVEFSVAVDRHHISDYSSGDVYIHLLDKTDQHDGECDVGMVTAATMFKLPTGKQRCINVKIPLPQDNDKNCRVSEALNKSTLRNPPPAMITRVWLKNTWEQNLHQQCKLEVPDRQCQFLYDSALRTIILHSPKDVYPGPYTYKRFWFRDAAFIVHGLLCAGFFERAERVLDTFPERQKKGGYFHSQEGEWDANGEVLWIMQRFSELTGRPTKPEWRKAILKGARWITRKRLGDTLTVDHAGLLPAGFSAEHLGPNDYYYWDDFWGIAGLRSAAALCLGMGDAKSSRQLQSQADIFQEAVTRSLDKVEDRLGYPALAASPYRRMDAGAIGSLACGYPLQLTSAKDPRLLGTVKFLLDHCFVNGGFFQDMIHSGINPYLTLHVAQILLRAEDPRYWQLMQTIADLASNTGQWPEAIHPSTGGGCMGDGQHVWAAAEWLLIVRHCFVREEGSQLIVGAGIPSDWLGVGSPIKFGPAPTTFGTVKISVATEHYSTRGQIHVSWHGDWHHTAPPIEIHVPGFSPVSAGPKQRSITLACDPANILESL